MKENIYNTIEASGSTHTQTQNRLYIPDSRGYAYRLIRGTVGLLQNDAVSTQRHFSPSLKT